MCSSPLTEKKQPGRAPICIPSALYQASRGSIITLILVYLPSRPLPPIIRPPASPISLPASNPTSLPVTEFIFLPQLLKQAEPRPVRPIPMASSTSELFEGQLPPMLHPPLQWWGTWWARPATYTIVSISFLPSRQSLGCPKEAPSEGCSQKPKTTT